MNGGWTAKPLGQLAVVGGGNSAPQDEGSFSGGTVPFFRTADAGRVRFGEIYESADKLNQKGAKGLRLFPKGTILFPKSGASTFLNHRVMLGVPGCVSSHLATIVVDESQAKPKFLLYFLSTVAAQDLIQDQPYPSLTLPMIEGIRVPLPPLREQERIVGILDEAFEGIKSARLAADQNLQNVRALFQSTLDSVFLPGDGAWVKTTLAALLALQPQNGWSPPATNHADAGTPVLTLSSVTGFRFRPEKVKFTSAQTDPRRHYWIRNGDFLISRSNTEDLVGHVAIARDIREPTIYPDLIMRMRPDPRSVLTEFLYYQMRSPQLRREIVSRARGANPTMKKLNNQAVKTIPISVPPLNAQRSIVKRLAEIDTEVTDLESLYRQKIAALDDLRASMLREVFEVSSS